LPYKITSFFVHFAIWLSFLHIFKQYPIHQSKPTLPRNNKYYIRSKREKTKKYEE